jgi:hypothetical protein
MSAQTNMQNLGARKARVGGSRWTTFEYKGTTLALANQVGHTSPEAVAPPVAIQPLDARRPLEVITANAIGMGTLVLEIIELWGFPIWEALGIKSGMLDTSIAQGSSTPTDLADLFNWVASTPSPINVKKYISPPAGARAGKNVIKPYITTYHNTVISDFQDDETISIGTMQIYKNITINYTRYTTDWNGLGKD